MTAIIQPNELASLLSSGAPVRLLDVRWRLDKPNGHDDYVASHLPGAVYVDLDHELAAHGRPASEGRHPLPSPDALQAAARRWGINPGDTVIAYDDFNSLPAARAWWLLRWAGFGEVRVLDGGLRGWREAGHPLEEGDVVPEPGAVHLLSGEKATLGIDDIAEFVLRGTLIDSRVPERYRGEVEPIDPRAGHIPGAINIPAAVYLDHGRFLDEDRLREVFAESGISEGDDVGTYCGSGITAAHTALALEVAGIEAAVYPGSWSQWSNQPDREVATGA